MASPAFLTAPDQNGTCNWTPGKKSRLVGQSHCQVSGCAEEGSRRKLHIQDLACITACTLSCALSCVFILDSPLQGGIVILLDSLKQFCAQRQLPSLTALYLSPVPKDTILSQSLCLFSPFPLHMRLCFIVHLFWPHPQSMVKSS